MRNLKRALSLVVASVMLLGMMVVGTSAASFSDEAEIVNKEAVEITAGLGLFAGSDGKFNPKGNVTRAQMATIIVKMLYGSEINADQFKGTNKFSDTASFEGGWAEGYINLCANLGIVKGFGDGTFKPGQSLTTAEAVTMIINALKVDAGEGTWPLTVMAKAEEMELFAELAVKPGTNEALTRDSLASIVLEGLNYSPSDSNTYTVSHDGKSFEFETLADALDAVGGIANIGMITENPAADTLAKTVFEMKSATGYILANQATGEDYTQVDGLKVALETGLDQLGHYVTVYYKDTWTNEAKPGTAYCIVEEADYITVSKAISADKKDYLAAFGSKVEDVDYPVLMSFDNAGYNYEYNTEEGADNTAYNAVKPAYNETAGTAAAGTYVVDSESGKIIAYIAPMTTAIDTVTRISTTAGKESIRLSTKLYQNNADDDVIVEYDGIAEDDIVVVKNYLGVTYLAKPEVVSGKITKTGTVDGDAATYINGTAYLNGSWDLTNAGTLSNSYAPDANKTYDAYLYNGKLIGVTQTGGGATLDNVVYVVNSYFVENAGTYGVSANHYYAQGVDATGKEVSILIGIQGVDDVNDSIPAISSLTANKFYTFEKSEDRDQAKKDIMQATEATAFGAFDADVDAFFGDTVTVGTGLTLSKENKYLTGDDAGRIYLTENTKFVVVEQVGGTTDELEIATYTGAIAKEIASGDLINVAVSEDDNGNQLAEIVVIYAAELSLKAEDYIYVIDGSDYSVVDGGYEYIVYASATNETKTIVADTTYATGFYDDYEINEDGAYELGVAVSDNTYVKNTELADSVFGTSINSTNIDLKDAANAIFVDVRAEDVLEDTEVAAITGLKDIQSAIKAGYRVYFSALLEDEGTTQVVTHIFVYSVQTETIDPDTGLGTGVWVEA